MNAETEAQRREVIENLLKVWTEYDLEVGGISLADMLGMSKLTDTQMVERFGSHVSPGWSEQELEWNTFDAVALMAERYPKSKFEDAADIVGRTYNLNAADRQHIRFIVQDHIKAACEQAVKDAQDNEVLRLLRQIACNTEQESLESIKAGCPG